MFDCKNSTQRHRDSEQKLQFLGKHSEEQARNELVSCLRSIVRADTLPLNRLSYRIIAAAIEIHRALGPGLLESTYRKCMVYELAAARLHVIVEKVVPVNYKSLVLDAGYRLDLLIEDTIIVELKAIEHVLPVHRQQLLTYLRHTQKPLGLLINFNVPVLKEGVVRIKNGF